jgi:hypothetical protein
VDDRMCERWSRDFDEFKGPDHAVHSFHGGPGKLDRKRRFSWTYREYLRLRL